MTDPLHLQLVVLGGASSEGTPTEPDPPPTGFTESETWSIMHLAQPSYAVALPTGGGALTEGEKAMMVGAYSGHDY